MRKLAVSTALLLLPLTGLAQTPRSGSNESGSQAIMAQYQQLAAERTHLKAQVDELQKSLDSTKSELAAAKKERDALKGRDAGTAGAVTRANAARQTAEQNLEQWKTRTNELVARFRDTAQTLKQTEAERDQLQRQLAERNTLYDKCVRDNLSLYELTSQALDRLDHVGLFTRVSASEPFTQITRARLDNLVDDYRARALELRAKEPKPRTP